MPSDMQNRAIASGAVCESTLRASRVTKQDTTSTSTPQSSSPQYRLIAVVAKSAREQFRISLRTFNGVRKVEIQIFERDHSGVFQPTRRRMAIGHGAIAAVISGLCEGEAWL